MDSDDNDIQELRERVDELFELTKESQKMIRSMYRTARWSAFFSVIKWALIIAITVGSLYYVQPFVTSFMKTYDSLSGNSTATSGISTFFKGANFLNSIESKFGTSTVSK